MMTDFAEHLPHFVTEGMARAGLCVVSITATKLEIRTRCPRGFRDNWEDFARLCFIAIQTAAKRYLQGEG